MSPSVWAKFVSGDEPPQAGQKKADPMKANRQPQSVQVLSDRSAAVAGAGNPTTSHRPSRITLMPLDMPEKPRLTPKSARWIPENAALTAPVTGSRTLSVARAIWAGVSHRAPGSLYPQDGQARMSGGIFSRDLKQE